MRLPYCFGRLHLRNLSPRTLATLAMMILAAQPAMAVVPAFNTDLSAARPAIVDFGTLAVSAEARRVADWVVASHDHGVLPFVIVDKVNARLFLFDGAGLVRASVPVLVGSAPGDDSVAGIGNRRLAAILPAERTTPAGRFVAQLGHDSSGEDILWVDYDAAIALHRATDVKPGLSAKSRLGRLASAGIGDNRASYGCIGVSADFYDNFIRPAFRQSGIVYVLPETRSAMTEFRIPALAGGLAAGA